MRHGNWEAHLRHELAHRRHEAAIATAAARGAELALARRLMPGERHYGITSVQLRDDAALRAAREEFRERHRQLTALRDECAGLEDELGMMADEAAAA